MKMRFLRTLSVVDPDSHLDVEISIYKTEGGGIVGIDSSFLSNTDEPIYSPFDLGEILEEVASAS